MVTSPSASTPPDTRRDRTGRCSSGSRSGISGVSRSGTMIPTMRDLTARREFLRFLAASPLLAADPQEPAAKDALSVMDFEALAHKALPPAHWGYMSTGVDDDLTLRANR